MQCIRVAGSALVLLVLMTSAAVADPSTQQLENDTRTSLAAVQNTDDASVTEHARPEFKEPIVAEGTTRELAPLMKAVHRIVGLTGGWRISAGISPGEQVLGVTANGHIVDERWTNFHISIGLPLR